MVRTLCAHTGTRLLSARLLPPAAQRCLALPSVTEGVRGAHQWEHADHVHLYTLPACLIVATALPFIALLSSTSLAVAARFAKKKNPGSLGDILGSSSGQGVCLF